MIWLMALAVSTTLFMERPLQQDGICWIENPQYIVIFIITVNVNLFLGALLILKFFSSGCNRHVLVYQDI